MKNKSVLILILVLFIITTTLTGCISARKLAGAGIGAAIGGVGMYALTGVPEVAIIMAVFGGAVGYNLTHEDIENLNNIAEKGQSGITRSWESNKGLLTATPSPAFTDKGLDCRNIQISFKVEGETKTSVQKMCREADRSNWIAMN